MSIDDLARAAAADAHRKAAEEVAPMTMLEDLHRTRRTRTVGTVVAMAAVVVTASFVSLTLFTGEHRGPTTPGTVSPTVVPSSGTDDPCADPAITCLGAERYRVALVVPVTVTLPDRFQEAFARFGEDSLEGYRSDADATGVTVFEDAVAVINGERWEKDPAAGSTAHSMATWLYHRPFLVDATMTQTTVGGRDAWRVSAQLKPGAHLLANKSGAIKSLAPTFTNASGATAGYGKQLIGDYTLVDVPGAGVTVIWSWTQMDDRSVLAGNQAYVDGLSFG